MPFGRLMSNEGSGFEGHVNRQLAASMFAINTIRGS